MEEFDLIVLGAGPGGYPAAITAAQAGAKVALVEKGELGGTCLNRGCIPTKALIAGADVLHRVRTAEEFGIFVGEVRVDYSLMNARKDQVVGKVRGGLEQLIASNQITLFQGEASFTSPFTVKVEGNSPTMLQGKAIIIATGSEPKVISAFPFDHVRIHDSTSILELDKPPKSLAIIGGGIIGCEFTSLYQALGVEVTVIEALHSILPTQSSAISGMLADVYKKRGVEIIVNAAVEAIDHTDSGVNVRLGGGKRVEAEMALVAIGRRRNTEGIGLEKAGVFVKEDGEIPTDDQMHTNVPHIFAIGDVTKNWWLAHVASHQGIVAARNALGGALSMHYNAVPSVIFTDPEIGLVGYTLEEALEKGYSATLGAFPFEALGKSQAAQLTEGFAQIVSDRTTKQILGAQVVGHEASTLVAEMGVVIANELTLEELTDTIHAHPTVAEVWLEAAMVANETPLHLPPKRKKTKA